MIVTISGITGILCSVEAITTEATRADGKSDIWVNCYAVELIDCTTADNQHIDKISLRISVDHLERVLRGDANG